MLVVELNKVNFEYDLNSLVRAFYPKEQVRVLTPESKLEKRPLSINKIKEHDDTVKNAGQMSEQGNQEYRNDKEERCQEDIHFCIRLEEKDAVITINGRDYNWHWQETLEEGYKDGFKRFLYCVLSEITGKSLPWGNLTGIRPTKMAYAMLEQGKGEEEIIEYYRQKHYVSLEKAQLSLDIARRERKLLAGVNYLDGYSLYIGIPFCPTTCLYCSFTSFPIGGYGKKVDTYIECLIKELEFVAETYGDKVLDSVYIGGGTPTTLEPEQLDRLLGNLKKMFDFSRVKEFTVEAGRADSITEEKLRVLYEYGVGRISVNPQSMKQETLDVIGRKASVKQVETAYGLARQVGFDNINMDLILGLPGELEEDVRHTIEKVTALGPDSLTVHSLAIKRASPLNRWLLENVDSMGERIALLHNTDETMRIAAEGAAKLGMVPYYLYRQKNMSGNFENVGYAKEGKFGLYNILIMEEKQSIVACGAGSISKRVYPDGRIERCENVKDVNLYIEKIDEMIERKRGLFAD